MQYWMISANAKIYNHAAAFEKWGFIDWRQNARYHTGDIVYIYCTRPYQKVMYKTIVEQESLTINEIVDDREFWDVKEEYEKALAGKYARLRLLEQVDHDMLSLPHLKEHGLKAAPQGPIRINQEMANFLDSYLKEDCTQDIFPESNIPEGSYEGSLKQIVVNRYERSSIARSKCIEYNGLNCAVCGMNFEKVYGEIGKGFIHVHHIVPLNTIGKEYVVDYKNDLIPVCPNCHAMLHRTINGKTLSIEDLKKILKNNK